MAYRNLALLYKYLDQFGFTKYKCLNTIALHTGSARVVKTLMGEGASFSCRRKRGMVIIYRVMVYAKMFYGGWCCFPGGMASSLNSSTAYRVNCANDTKYTYFKKKQRQQRFLTFYSITYHEVPVYHNKQKDINKIWQYC